MSTEKMAKVVTRAISEEGEGRVVSFILALFSPKFGDVYLVCETVDGSKGVKCTYLSLLLRFEKTKQARLLGKHLYIVA